MKKRIVFALSLLATCLLLALSWRAMDNGHERPGKLVTFKLAALLPETGRVAYIGQAIKNALVLANEEQAALLAAKGIAVKLVFADTEGEPRKALGQFTWAADVEKAHGIITVLSGVIGAINPLARERDMLLIALTPDPSFLANNDKGIRVLFSFDKEGADLTRLITDRGWKKVLLLHSSDAATAYEVTKILQPGLANAGIAVTSDSFTPGQRDFAGLCAKYGADKWDGVIYQGFGSDVPPLGEACGVFPSLAAAPKLGALSILDARPEQRKKLAGMQFFAPAFLAGGNPEYAAFVERYNKRFPATIGYSSAYAYDAYLLLTSALARRQTTSGAALKAELLQPGKALTEEYRFQNNGDYQPATVLLEIAANGELRPVEAR